MRNRVLSWIVLSSLAWGCTTGRVGGGGDTGPAPRDAGAQTDARPAPGDGGRDAQLPALDGSGAPPDAGASEAGALDAGASDAGASDAGGPPDDLGAAIPDAGGNDLGMVVPIADAGTDGGRDLGVTDAGPPGDAGPPDLGPVDGGPTGPLGRCANPISLEAMGMIGPGGVLISRSMTTGGGDSGTSSCGSGAAPDVVYSFTAPRSGTFFATTAPSSSTPGGVTNFDSVLYLRTACSTASSQLVCDDDAGGSLTSRIFTTLSAGQTVFLFVDGRGGGSGNYELRVIFDDAPAVGEACVQAVPALRCPASSLCTPTAMGSPDSVCEPIVQLNAGDACTPGSMTRVCAMGLSCLRGTCQMPTDMGCGLGVQVVDLPAFDAGGVTRYRGSTAGGGSAQNGLCGGAGSTAPEVAHRFTLPYAAEVRVDADPTWNQKLYLRTDCTQSNTEIACSTGAFIDFNPTLGPVPGGTTLYAIVDGNQTAESGAYDLAVRIRRVVAVGAACDPSGLANRCVDGAFCADMGGGPRCVSAATDLGCGMGVPLVDLTSRIDATGTVQYTGSTTSFANRNRGSCAAAPGPEVAHRIVLPYEAEVRVDTTTSWARQVYLRTGTCAPPSMGSNELACSSTSPIDYTATALLPAGTELFVFVDGTSMTASGTYDLTIRLRRIVALGQPCDESRLASRCATGSFCGNMGAGPVCLSNFDNLGCGIGVPVVDLTPRLDANGVATFTGTTAGLTGRNQCTTSGTTTIGMPGSEVAHRLVLPYGADVRVEGDPSWDEVLYVRRDICGVPPGVQLSCSDAPSIDYATNGMLPAGTVLFVFMDGFSAAANGEYTLTVRLRRAALAGETCGTSGGTTIRCDTGLVCRGTPAGVCGVVTCGDNLVEGTEQCDDGNTMDDDGCSAMCRIENSGQGGDTCAMPQALRFVRLTATQRRAIASGTTVGQMNDLVTGTGCGSGSDGPDVVYALTVTQPSSVGITLTPGASLDAVLHVHSTSMCIGTAAGGTPDYAPPPNGTAATGCRDSGGPGSNETLNFANLPAGTYYIVVDGKAGSSGTFDLTVTTTP